jgi:UDP-glucose 4-epimerase
MNAINIAKKLSNKKFKITIGPRRKNDIEKSIANINKIKKYIKWKPKYNDLKKIIISSYKWEVNCNKFKI